MSGPAPLAFRAIEAGGRREWLTGRPRDGASTLLILQPLFAEMNRGRGLVADLMAALSAAGYAPWTLDLPGLGESETPLETIGWEDWEAAVAVAARETNAIASLALRGGALLDGCLARRWRFAPASGAALLRDLVRTRLAGGAEPTSDTASLTAQLAAATTELAGYRLTPALTRTLQAAAVQGPARTVMLAEHAGAADAQVDGPALWRRAEPGRAPDLATGLAQDITTWLANS